MSKIFVKVDDPEILVQQIGENYLVTPSGAPFELVLTPEVYESLVEYYQQNIITDEVGESDLI